MALCEWGEATETLGLGSPLARASPHPRGPAPPRSAAA